MIDAKIIADSQANGHDSRLTTFICAYPRFIHSEMMTHRALSKNSASSRAIPVRKMIEAVADEPAWPVKWPAEQKGMAGGEDMPADQQRNIFRALDTLRQNAYWLAGTISNVGLHKSVVNRYLEPWAHMTIIVTGESKGWQNFFALRAHPMAQPEFQVLAYVMLGKYLKSTPAVLSAGDWHVPFGDRCEGLQLADRLKVATGRCARVSYLTHDGMASQKADIELHDRLANSRPVHASAFEHCAQYARDGWPVDPSNFGRPWMQYRKYIKGETSKMPREALELRWEERPEWVKTAIEENRAW